MGILPSKHLHIGLYLLGVIVAGIASIWQSSPGFMDADYYFGGGLQLVRGEGFWEPYIWNYLSEPSELPQPSHTYWMPLPSILAALGMWVGGEQHFKWAQVFFIVLSGFVPVLAMKTAKRYVSNQRYAWISGLLAAFPGVYLVYIALPETFLLYILGGATIFFLINRIERKEDWGKQFKDCLLLGIGAGWMHLSRADGMLWLVGIILWIVGRIIRKPGTSDKLRIAIILTSLILVGYLSVMGIWYLRNLQYFATFTAPGASRTLWMTDYFQTFSYPASIITFDQWINTGIGLHLKFRWDALILNLQNLLVVQGGIVLLPVMMVGLWAKRREVAVQFAFWLWIATLFTMSVIFPFAGSRGGYLHSAAAFQVLLWAMFPVGLEIVAGWGKRMRNLPPHKTMQIFGTAAIGVNLVIGGWFFHDRVIGTDPKNLIWNQNFRVYEEVGDYLQDNGYARDTVILVNNPPGFHIATGFPAIVIPYGELSASLAAARQFNGKILVLEEHQVNLSDLYNNPGKSEQLEYLDSVGGARIFRIKMDE